MEIVTGDDGVARCSWGASTADYAVYHDDEWGVGVSDEQVGAAVPYVRALAVRELVLGVGAVLAYRRGRSCAFWIGAMAVSDAFDALVYELLAELGTLERAKAARALGQEYGTCRILTGDVEVFDTAPGSAWETVPRFALGVRVMVPETGDLLMMKELQGSGEDGEWVFKRGRQHALAPLVEDALGSVLDELDGSN